MSLSSCDRCGQPHPSCHGHRKHDGQPCGGAPLTGATLCRKHLTSPKGRARAALKTAVAAFSPTDQLADPNLVLLQQITVMERQAAYFSELIAALHDQLADTLDEDDDGAGPDLEDLVRLFVFDTYGEDGKSGEDIRALFRWHAHWVELTAKYAKVAIDADVQQRAAAVREHELLLVEQVVVRALGRFGIEGNADQVRTVLVEELKALGASVAT